MDDQERKRRLENALNKALAIERIFKSSDFRTYLLPHLNELAFTHPIDPTKYTSDKEFHFALQTTNARAHVFAELIKFFSSQEAVIQKIREEIERPKKNYGIE